MEHLTRLFKLLQLTRSMPQYGYALAGIKKAELSDLSQHHYLVSFIAWQLARQVVLKGAKINTAKVVEFALVHDLGELFGGDIAMPYVRANPGARKLAKAFEKENVRYISEYFGNDKKYFEFLTAEIVDQYSTDERIIMKLADYIEVAYYKQYIGKFTKGDVDMSYNAMVMRIGDMRDKIAKRELKAFAKKWKAGMLKDKNGEFFEAAKK